MNETIEALARALKDYQIQLDEAKKEAESLKRENERLKAWDEINKSLLDDKTALIQAYEQKINELRAENKELNESRRKWIDSWMTAGSELFELKEKMKAMEEATK